MEFLDSGVSYRSSWEKSLDAVKNSGTANCISRYVKCGKKKKKKKKAEWEPGASVHFLGLGTLAAPGIFAD